MKNKNFIIILCLFLLTGCALTDNLDYKFAYYFQLLNTTKDKNLLSHARQEVEQIFLALEAQDSEHLPDYIYLLNAYRAAEVATVVHNAERMRALIRGGLHPANNTRFKKEYQKAKEPVAFSKDTQSHLSALGQAYINSKALVFSHDNRNYNFSELIDAWVKLKKVNDLRGALIKFAYNLEGGMCFGVSTLANNFVCQDPNIKPQKIIDKLNKHFDDVISEQIQHSISVKLFNKNKLEVADAYIKHYSSGQGEHVLSGFVLRSEVKLFMAKLLKEQINEGRGRSFVARVSFSGDKSGHAVAIQMLRDGQEYRLIDNNIGVLSFSTLEEFLEAFANYRLSYYGGSSRPVMWVFWKFC